MHDPNKVTITDAALAIKTCPDADRRAARRANALQMPVNGGMQTVSLAWVRHAKRLYARTGFLTPRRPRCVRTIKAADSTP